MQVLAPEPMIRANSVCPAGSLLTAPVDKVLIGFDQRRCRRIVKTTCNGLTFLIDLPGSVALANGDAFVLEDGRLVEVAILHEDLARLRVRAPAHLARLAWHLGNRHLPVQITDDGIVICRDAVIEEMARRLGAEVAHVSAAFEPEVA